MLVFHLNREQQSVAEQDPQLCHHRSGGVGGGGWGGGLLCKKSPGGVVGSGQSISYSDI